MKISKFCILLLTIILVLSCSACKKEKASDASVSSKDASSSADLSQAGDNTSSDTPEEEDKYTLVRDVTVRSGSTKTAGAGTAVEKLSYTPLTDSSSFTVKEAVNFKWIAYDNFTLHQQYEETTTLANGGYLIYVELPEVSFDHEMYFEFFADNEKVKEYSGEVAYTGKDGVENELPWYSLPLGATEWTEHTIPKYKLCFGDGGKEFKGYIFIPAESLTYRYESDSLSDVCIYVKTGVETGKGETGRGITFTVSTVLPVESFDPTVTIAQSGKGRVDLSKNEAIQ